MTPAVGKPAHLSIHRALVVQSRPDPAVEQGNLAVRVEHGMTGQAADVQSLETCWRSSRSRSSRA
jgi:hypothetical protein